MCNSGSIILHRVAAKRCRQHSTLGGDVAKVFLRKSMNKNSPAFFFEQDHRAEPARLAFALPGNTLFDDAPAKISVNQPTQDPLHGFAKILVGDIVPVSKPRERLWAGARPREYEALMQLFRALECAPIDSETGRQAGDYLRQYRKSHGLELGDALVASATLLNRVELWTRNRKHYPMKELSFY
jgi:hypothetical protein